VSKLHNFTLKSNLAGKSLKSENHEKVHVTHCSIVPCILCLHTIELLEQYAGQQGTDAGGRSIPEEE